jgi:YD repeat-containing protein
MTTRRRSSHRAVVLFMALALLFPQLAAAQSPAPSALPRGAGPVGPLSGSAIVLPRDGTIFASIESSSAGASSDFGIDQPSHELLVADATHNVGAVVTVGTFSAGTSLVFYIFTPSFGTTYLSTSDHAQVEQQGPDNWIIHWEDQIDFDFDDLVTRISYDPPVEGAPDGTEANENGGNGGDPVQTFSGAFQYRHLDLSVPGRGPSPSFLRAYSSADTRVGPLGPGWTYSYNIRLRSPGDATSDLLLVGPDGNTDRYVAGPGGTYSPPSAVYRALVRNANRTFTATDKARTIWTFSPGGSLIAITDRFSNTSTLGYDTGGNLTSVSDPAGRGSLSLGYTAGRLTSVADWASPARNVTYQYDGNGRLWKVIDREGKTTTFGYDGTTHRLTTFTDARGHVALTLTYDAQGRVATQKDARGLTTGDITTFGYVVNPDGTRVTTVTSPPTSFEPTFSPTIVDTYSSLGFLTGRVSHPSSIETLSENYAYDATGDRISVTDPRGNRTDFCYDLGYSGISLTSRGNLTRRIDPPPTAGANRPVSMLAYDVFDNVVQTVAPKGVSSGGTVTCLTDLAAIATAYATDFAYDGTGARLTSVTRRFNDPDLGLQTATTKYEYGDAANPGAITRVIPPRGNTGPSPDYTYATAFTYFGPGTKSGMPATTVDALGNKTGYDYDAIGRLASTVDPLGNAAGGVPADHTTSFSYDNEDRTRYVRLPAPVGGGAQLVTETRYDEVGNLTVRIDAKGQVSTYAYDERGGLFQVKESPNTWTDPASPPTGVITTEYAHDAAGNLTRMTRAKGDATNERATDYAFDGRGLVRQETQYPAWPTTTPTLVTTNAYDPNGNLVSVVDPLNRTAVSGFDALNRRTTIDYSDPGTPDVAYAYDANGNRTSMTGGTGVTSYVYDEADRLTSVASPGPKTVGYRYDLDGNRTKLIYPDATAVTYTFNKASQLASLLDWASRSVAYTYWPDGLVKTETNPDSSVARYAYDNSRRMTDILHETAATTISHHGYVLDQIGNVTGLDESLPWSTATPVNDIQTGNQYGPDVAIGADGATYAVWADARTPGDTDIFYARRDPVTGIWGPNERVAAAVSTQTDPAVAVDGSNNVYVIWQDWRVSSSDEDIYFAKRSASSGTWSASVRVNDDGAGSRQGAPDIAVTPTGAAVAVWYDPRGGASKQNIYSARLAAGASTWSANIRVTSNQSAPKSGPKVVVGSTGIAYSVWSDGRNGNLDIYFASLAVGSSTWSTNVKVSDDAGTATQQSADIGIDAAGNLTAVWQHGGTSPSNVRASRRLAGRLDVGGECPDWRNNRGINLSLRALRRPRLCRVE